MQGIFQGLYFGAGQGLGALIGGLLMQRYGGQSMFFLCSVITLAGWLLCAAAQQAEHITSWCRSKRMHEHAGHSSTHAVPSAAGPVDATGKLSLGGRYSQLNVVVDGDVEVGNA